MKAEPLKKAIYNKAKELGIEEITLKFSGGSDEGYLDVELYPFKTQGSIESEIEDWAWEVYEYNGAGDGNDYGDDIVYDLVNGKVSTSEWFTSREENENEDVELEIEKE